MSNIAIEFDNVGKLYRLGVVGTGSLVHDLTRWWQTSVLHREDPYLKIGETNDRSKRGTSDYVWALRDISFSVEQGDVVGIIGKNGAGKSTLLKLLSRVTSPITGAIRARGRIGSLLEVGTGFHPELTGRENIYMNGSIMGMTKHEIDRKLDEIVDFAGVERYLDTPVKRYSSGMTVRLGFSVAAHLEPEILVVDEVLAVGDAEFQKKAIGKMQDVSKGGGRTVLFVSHNMASVRMLCNKGVVLKNGMVAYQGTQIQAIDFYLSNKCDGFNTKKKIMDAITFKKSYLNISSITVNGTENIESTLVSNANCLEVEITGNTSEPLSYDLMVILKSKEGVPLASLAEGHYKGRIKKSDRGEFKISSKIKLPKYLSKGTCLVDIFLHHPNVEYLLKCKDCALLHMDGNYVGFGKPLDLSEGGIAGLECEEDAG